MTTIEAQSWQEPKLDQAGQPLKGADGQPVMEDKSGQTQSIAVGPVASQLAIKMLGTNGGGFFNANSAHPLREPDRGDQCAADAVHLSEPRGAVLRHGPAGG